MSVEVTRQSGACGQCGTLLAPAARFCSACGTAVPRDCPSCGLSVAPGARFCAQCGTALDSLPAQGVALAHEPASGERRQITVVYCDLVDSTALAHRLDPEEFGAVVRDYQHEASAIVQRFDGHVAQYLGDGILIYFGYPQAHEDDAERAVRAGLAIVHAMQALDRTWRPRLATALGVRIGTHTGLVLIDEIGAGEHHERLALGETPNVAARLQALAAPGNVVVSAQTCDLLAGRFEFEDLGLHTLKGIVEPRRVMRVVRPVATLSRFDATARVGLTPLVGRAQELGLLRDRWQLTQDGDGQVVVIAGEPGIGKSRLLRELREALATAARTVLRFQCSPFHVNSAYYPLVDHLERTLAFSADTEPDMKRAALEALVVGTYGLPAAHAHSLAMLLGIPYAATDAASATPQRHKDDTLAAAVALTCAAARNGDALMLFEDAHWADPTTLEFLDLLLAQIAQIPLFVVITHRPAFTAPWTRHGHVTAIALSHLSRSQTGAIVTRLTAGKALPMGLFEEIVAKTSGVPLFVEEVTRAILESGQLRETDTRYELAQDTATLAVPVTLRDSLMARLDRHAGAKDVAQIGAVIGREFDYPLIAAVAPLEPHALAGGLDELTAAGLVFRRGSGNAAVYTFKHALVQDAAYESIPRVRRQALHCAVAQALARPGRDAGQAAPELLAHHWTEGGQALAAIPCWLRAGQRALERSANTEAIAHLRRGLAVNSSTGEDRQKLQRELQLLLAVTPALMGKSGYASPEVAGNFARMRELTASDTDSIELFTTLYSLWLYYANIPDYPVTNELMDRLDALAELNPTTEFRLASQLARGVVLGWCGEFEASRRLLEACVALYQPERDHALTFRYGGLDLGTFASAHLGLAYWYLGFPEHALRQSQAAVALARRLEHPLSLSHVLAVESWIRLLCGKGAAAQRIGETARQVANEQHAVYWMAWSEVHLGALTNDVDRMRQGMSALHATGSLLARPMHCAILAQMLLDKGAYAEMAAVLCDGMDNVNQGEAMAHAEIERLHGELVRASGGDLATAETHFERAIAIARQQVARSWELRATTSLAQLWAQRGREAAARDRLAAVYDSFTEGFDTADLRAAATLLERWS